jgi:hypothetical protein
MMDIIEVEVGGQRRVFPGRLFRRISGMRFDVRLRAEPALLFTTPQRQPHGTIELQVERLQR